MSLRARSASVIAIVLLIASFACAEPVKDLKPTGYVNDFAHVLSADTVAKLNGLAQQVDEKAGAQIALVTVNTLDGRYLAGPVKVATLPDGGTRDLQLGAFLPALSSGKHTVQLFGEYDGVAVQKAIQGSFLRDVITYTVTVR